MKCSTAREIVAEGIVKERMSAKVTLIICLGFCLSACETGCYSMSGYIFL